MDFACCRLCGGSAVGKQPARCSVCHSEQREVARGGQGDGAAASIRHFLQLAVVLRRCSATGASIVDLGNDEGLFAALLRGVGHAVSHRQFAPALGCLPGVSGAVVTAFSLLNELALPREDLPLLLLARPALLITATRLVEDRDADSGERFVYGREALASVCRAHGYELVVGRSYRLLVQRPRQSSCDAPLVDALIAALPDAEFKETELHSVLRDGVYARPSARPEIADSRREIPAGLLGPLPELERQRDFANAQAGTYAKELSALYSSLSWRLTGPLRTAKHYAADMMTRARQGKGGAAPAVFVAPPIPDVAQHVVAPPLVATAPPAPQPAAEILATPAPLEPFALPTSATPLVSVVVPVYGKSKLTYAFLKSVAQAGESVPFEVIAVDDGSPDDTQEVLGRIANLRLCTNEKNLGYLRSVNRGVAQARGEYVLIMNNDCEVEPGWMSALLAVFQRDAGVGLAGSKLVRWDGRLQAAGSSLLPSGHALEIGHGDDPTLPAYEFPREVLFCAGASMMLPRALFEQLGGLDELFLPCYFEDSDLALRVRALGKKVVYEPRSVVRHHVSATIGSSSATEIIAGNQPKFLARWGKLLEQLNVIRVLAFFRCSFFPVPELEQQYGKGHTDWSLVTAAQPCFGGHAQPQLPTELGFYDQRHADAHKEQARLAKAHGIDGFCFELPWFPGRPHLLRPFFHLLENGDTAMPFCIAWANESWTADGTVLLAQEYGEDAARALIRELLPALRNSRYLRVHGRPLFVVTRPDLIPEPVKTTALWREICVQEGVGDPYLVYLEAAGETRLPATLGFDASIESPAQGGLAGELTPPPQALSGARPFLGHVYSYEETVRRSNARKQPGYVRFRSVLPGWDDSPRRGPHADICTGSPALYEQWLRGAIAMTHGQQIADERLVFIRSFNDWASGCYLEPDRAHGSEYLLATRRAIRRD